MQGYFLMEDYTCGECKTEAGYVIKEGINCIKKCTNKCPS